MNTESAAVAINPYQPPQAHVADAEVDVEQALYVVAPAKFLILTIATANLYIVYWFYKNWAMLNRKQNAYWPVPRAIFALFFTHSLFGEIEARRQRNGQPFVWSPRFLATIYVTCIVGTIVLSQINAYSGGHHTAAVQVVNLLLIVPQIWVIYSAQKASNAAENDPRGGRNAMITAANIVWIVIGALWWLSIAFSMYVIFTTKGFA